MAHNSYLQDWLGTYICTYIYGTHNGARQTARSGSRTITYKFSPSPPKARRRKRRIIAMAFENAHFFSPSTPSFTLADSRKGTVVDGTIFSRIADYLRCNAEHTTGVAIRHEIGANELGIVREEDDLALSKRREQGAHRVRSV